MTVNGKIDEVIKILGHIKEECGADTPVFMVIELMRKQRLTPEEVFTEALLKRFSKLI